LGTANKYNGHSTRKPTRDYESSPSLLKCLVLDNDLLSYVLPLIAKGWTVRWSNSGGSGIFRTQHPVKWVSGYFPEGKATSTWREQPTPI